MSSANSSDEARFNVTTRGFWQRGNVHFLTSGFLNLSQRATLTRNLTRLSRAMRKRKKRQYNQRIIEVEHGSLSPLVFSPYGERFLTELVLKLSEKKQIDYSIAICWRRERLAFNLLRSAVLCVRGSRTTKDELNSDFSGAEIGKCDWRD